MPRTIHLRFARRLLLQCRRRRITRTRLCGETGIHPSALSRLTHGETSTRYRWRLEQVWASARALGYASLKEFFEDLGL